MLFIYIYYFKEPFELHVNVTVQFCVSTATPSTYLFAIAFAFSIFGSIVTTFSQLLQNTCVSSPKSPPICRTVSFVLKGYQFIKFWLTVDK